MTLSDLDEIRQEAYQEGLIDGWDEGYSKGYDDGYYDRQCDVADFVAEHRRIPPIEYGNME